MNVKPWMVDLKPEIRNEVERIAAGQGLAVEAWVAKVVSDTVATHRFFEARRKGGSRDKLLEILDKVPDVEPEPWDRLD